MQWAVRMTPALKGKFTFWSPATTFLSGRERTPSSAVAQGSSLDPPLRCDASAAVSLGKRGRVSFVALS